MSNFEIYYKGLGKTIRFDKAPFLYDTHNLFDYSYDYGIVDLPSGLTSSLERMTSFATNKEITLQVVGNQKYDLMNMLHDQFKKDIDHYFKTGELARLYVNESYVECLVSAKSHTKWNAMKLYEKIVLRVVIPKPRWIEEKEISFVGEKKDDSVIIDDSILSLPNKIPFKVVSSKSNRFLTNEYIGDVLSKIIIFGPVINPAIFIGNNEYKVNLELLVGERVEICQRSKKIRKITASGAEVNVFNLRDKSDSIFKPIPEGTNNVSASDNFPFSVKLFYERGEPKWN